MAEDTNKQWKTPGSINESPWKHPPMVDGREMSINENPSLLGVVMGI